MPKQLDLDRLRTYMQREYPTLAQRAMVEAGYYNLNGVLPRDAVVFERFEWHGNQVTIVHQDHYAVRQ